MKLVDFEEGGTLEFDVSVKNTGQMKLFKVELITDPSTNLECTVKTSARDIDKNNVEKYTVSCSNITNNRRVSLKVQDKYKATSDIESLRFKLVE
jgi:hypothetical protein